MRVCESPLCKVEFEPNTHNQKYHDPRCKRDVENVSRRRAVQTEVALQQEAQVIQVPDVGEEEQIAYLRTTNQRLYRENIKLKVEKKEVATAVYTAVREFLTKTPNAVVAPPREPTPRTTNEEVAIWVLSDWQYGKKTVTYNMAECEAAIATYVDKALRITDMQRSDHPVNEVKIWCLGDMLEGEAIFPSQAHHIDGSLHAQVIRCAELISKHVITPALENYDRVKFVGISGNHGAIGGRSRHEMHPETNADRMIYSIVQLIHENDPRIEWDIPSGEHEGDFYTIDYIGEKKCMLFHGHQIKGSGAYRTIENRVFAWRDIIDERFDYAVCGHFHNPTRLTINSAILFINGTTETSNGWAVEELGKKGRPCQYLLFGHPDHGITAEYPIYLDL